MQLCATSAMCEDVQELQFLHDIPRVYVIPWVLGSSCPCQCCLLHVPVGRLQLREVALPLLNDFQPCTNGVAPRTGMVSRTLGITRLCQRMSRQLCSHTFSNVSRRFAGFWSRAKVQ